MKRLDFVRLCYSANTETLRRRQFFLHPLSTSTFDHQRALVLQQRRHRVIMENFLNTPGLLSLGTPQAQGFPSPWDTSQPLFGMGSNTVRFRDSFLKMFMHIRLRPRASVH